MDQETDGAVLVTRPEGSAEGLCARLAQAGYRAVHQPLLVVSPVQHLSDEQQGLVRSLDTFQHCVFVSRNAARYGLAHLRPVWPEWPPGLQCYAVGDSTADVLRTAGLTVQVPGVDMTSEGLLALPSLRAVAGQRVLIVKGEGGRNALRDALIDRGARVEALRCYRRSAPDLQPSALKKLLRSEQVASILVSSGEVLDNLVALLQASGSRHPALTELRLVVPSARVAEQARASGWRRVVTATNASDEAMLSALQYSPAVQEKTGD